jgi:hypothetical protein
MKKWIALLLFLGLLFALPGCGSSRSSGRSGSAPAGVNDVLEAGMAAADSSNTGESSPDNRTDSRQSGAGENAPAPEPADESGAAAVSAEGIDVDLTALSSTMVYSEVSNMMVEPEQYIGKTVKMDGLFAYYHDEATDNYYFACIIQDATACCAQGIEFVLTDDYSYPEDYPQVDDEICVVGVFDTYQEGSYTYCTLRNAQLLNA